MMMTVFSLSGNAVHSCLQQPITGADKSIQNSIVLSFNQNSSDAKK